MKKMMKKALFAVMLVLSAGLLSLKPVDPVPSALSKLAEPLGINLKTAAENWLHFIAHHYYISTAPESEFIFYNLFNLGSDLDEKIRESGNKDVEECEKRGDNSSNCYLRSFRNKVLFPVYSSATLRETVYSWLLPGWQEMVLSMDMPRKKLLSKTVNHFIDYAGKFDYSKELAFYKFSLEKDKDLFISEYPVINGRVVWDETLRNPYRRGEAWIFRRIHSKQMTISDISNWLEKIKKDLVLDNTDESYVLYPRNVKTLYDSAEALISRKDYLGAVKKYSEGLENVRKSPVGFLTRDAKAFYYRALAKNELKDVSGAVIDLDESLRIDAELAESYFLRGKINYELGQYAKAVTDLDFYINGKYRDVLALKYRAISKFHLGDYPGSTADLTEIIAKKPQTRYYGFGKPEDLTGVITSEQDKNYYYYLRGMVRNVAGAYDFAISDLNKAIELFYKTGDVYSVLGDCWYNKQDYRKAVYYQDQAIDIDKQNAVAFFRRGSAKYKLKDYTGAISDFDQSLKISPQNSISYERRADARFMLNDLSGAQTDYKKATELKPDGNSSYIRLCEVNRKLNDLPSMLEAAKKGLENKPNDTALLGNLGYYYLETGDFAAAKESYLKSYYLDNKSIDVVLGLMLASHLTKDKENARKYFEEAKKIYPKIAGGMEGITALESEGYAYSENHKKQFEKVFKKVIR